MPSILANAAVSPHLGRLENVVRQPAKADLKNLEERWKQALGRAIQRCFEIAGLTSKEVAALIDRDAGQISKWLSGVERPQLDVLFACEQLRQPLVIALAELGGAGVEITTHITVRRIA